MRQSRQAELLDRLVGVDTTRPWLRAAASRRNPAQAYTDPVRFEREQARLFRGRPQFVGLSADCPDSGDYLAVELGGVPIVLVRQANGELAAFVNVCRHRGATIASGRGRLAPDEGSRSAARLVCPYHGWTYESSGALCARPGAWDGFADLPQDLSLHPRAVSERYGLIFVHPDSTVPFAVDAVLAGAEQELADYGFADYVQVETRTRDWRMNWKLALDTFTEAYHIRFLHQNTIAPHFLCDMIFDAFGPHPRAIGLRREVTDQLTQLPRAEWRLLPYATAQYFLVPNGLLVFQRDHVEAWRIEPLAVDAVRLTTTLYAPAPPADDRASAYWRKNLDLLLDVTGAEDFPLMEQIQRNLASGAMPEVVYGRLEPALVHLHDAIDALLAQPDAN